MSFAGLAREIEAAIEAEAFPGAVVLVSRGNEVLYHAAFGARSLVPARTDIQLDTLFDLSSLTKPLATTTAFMLLVRENRIRLDDRVTRFFADFGVHRKTHVTFRSVLAHASGLPGWRPYWQEIVRLEKQGRLRFVGSPAAKAFVYEQVHRERPEYETGTRSIYSDLGFMLLGEVVELVSGMPLDRFCHERIVRPLGLKSMSFFDLGRLRQRQSDAAPATIAPTEQCPWRGRVLCGEVHDDNAWAMGGVAGHAGLFATAADVDALAGRLHACWRGEDDFVPADIVREFWRRDPAVAGSSWALGWDTPSATGSSAGDKLSSHAVGHLGFTGTSLWIDLERNVRIVLLTNRVHPRRDNDRIRQVRPRVHDAAMEALGA